MGSSPLTRGARLSFGLMRLGLRLIPAYAGSTCGESAYAQTTRAHPRLRGEHCNPQATTPHMPGSSPLTRGAPSTLNQGTVHLRLIPAYAGSTLAEQEQYEPKGHFTYSFERGLKAYLLEYANLPLSVGCISCGLGGLSTNPSDASSALVYVGASLT